MPFTVRFAHHPGSFIVMEGENVLDAALRQNYFIPYSCHEGLCSTCEGQIIDGEVIYYNEHDLALDADERAAGKALFCSAIPQSDLIIDVPGIVLPKEQTPVEYDYRIKSFKPLSGKVYEIILEPTELVMEYLAGQYLEILLPDEMPRPFSIANAPLGEGEIQLHVRYQSSTFYSTKLFSMLVEGALLKLRGPFGRCLFHHQPLLPSVFIAQGTGFAPIKAILEEAMTHGLKQPAKLFWAGKSLQDLYLLDLAQRWQQYVPYFEFFPILTGSELPLGWTGEQGVIQEIVLKHCPNLSQHHIYFGGAMELTLSALELFSQHGAESRYIYSDAFDLA